MRVLVAVDSIGGIGSLEAGSLIAAAWAELGDEVAVVPMASGGAALREAVGALAPGLDFVDLAGSEPPGDSPMIGVVDEAELTRPLLGLHGLQATTGRERGLALDEVLAADAEAEAWVAANWPDRPGIGLAPGSGAHGGSGIHVLAAGGRLITGPRLCAELAGLGESIARADLVITGCETLDFGAFGGPVVAELIRLCDEATAPLLVLCGSNYVSSRELRSAGIEAAHVVLDANGDSPPREELSRRANRLARSWRW